MSIGLGEVLGIIWGLDIYFRGAHVFFLCTLEEKLKKKTTPLYRNYSLQLFLNCNFPTDIF